MNSTPTPPPGSETSTLVNVNAASKRVRGHSAMVRIAFHLPSSLTGARCSLPVLERVVGQLPVSPKRDMETRADGFELDLHSDVGNMAAMLPRKLIETEVCGIALACSQGDTTTLAGIKSCP